MPGPTLQTTATSLLAEVWSFTLDDYALATVWSHDHQFLAAMPSNGRIVVVDHEGRQPLFLDGHGQGNGTIAWHPRSNTLATCGHGGTVHIYHLPETTSAKTIALGKGWAERMAWNADGSLLAVALGRSLLIIEADTGEIRHTYDDHKSTVFDLVWNPRNPNEIATVCDGGARMWRLGEAEPFGHFDWGGASLVVTWSPDGRWVVTGDQTSSVHLYDVTSDTPLHIQGYETKVKSFSWQESGTWLATAGGLSIIVWPCTGKKGPDGAKPIQLFGHERDVSALQFVPGSSSLLSGGRDGMVLLWKPHESDEPALLLTLPGEVSSLQACSTAMATGTADGLVSIHKAPVKQP